jgi:F-type H+-transporting ATPase subunit b
MITAAKLKDLFWRTANFIALVIILVKFLAKPIAGGLAGRRRGIREEIETLEAKRDEAERSYKEFESRLAGMEKEMDTVVEKAIAMAQDEKVRILNEAEQSAEDIKRQAEAAVNAAVVEAKRSLQEEVADQAAAMAEELIVKNLTPEDQVTITEQYLEKVGAVQ